MTSLSTNDILNRVLIVHNRSLPMYLHDAAPWVRHGEGDAIETLRQIVRDHKQVVERVGAMITDNNGVYELGEYPLPFTAYHDVSFDWLLPMLIDREERTIKYLQQCAQQLALAPMAKALVEETMGMAKGHLEMLQELKTSPAVTNGVLKPAAPRVAPHT
jgi:hypothetical protein